MFVTTGSYANWREKGFSDAASLTNPPPPRHTDTEIKDGNMRVAGSIGTH